MAGTYLLRGARQLLTLSGSPGARRGAELLELSIIPDGALLIRDGRIEEVGMSRRVENLAAARNATVIDATGRVVMPAFIDPSASLVFAHSGTDRNEQRLRFGVPQTAASQREDVLEAARALGAVSKKRLMMRASLLASTFARHGTGLVGAVSGYGLDRTGETKILSVAGAIAGEPIDVIPILGADAVPNGLSAETFARSVLAPLSRFIARRKLSAIAAVRCGPAGFNPQSARPFLLAARQAGMQRAIYCDQFPADDGSDEAVQLASDVEAISATHLENLSDRGVDILAASQTIAVLTPAATFHMGLPRFAPARKLIDRGAAIALATAFNPDRCPTHSMPFTLTLACRYLGMQVAEALVASTINAAHVLGCAHRTGSLQTGKQADLLILNARDYRELPLTPGLNLVDTMFSNGKIVYGPGHR